MKEENIMNLVPTVLEKTSYGERAYDLFSRMLKDRIVFIGGPIDEAMANVVVAELLFLEAQDPDANISIYINSPGGSVSAGMAIYDTMKYIKCPVTTICVGMAASMGSFLLSGGDKGKRLALPNAEIMIHQPLGGAQGQARDIEIAAEHIIAIKKKLYRILAANTDKTLEQITADCDRDNWLSAEDALKYGIIDKVVETKP